MFLACSRPLFLMTFLAGTLALGASYYLEYVVGLEPCLLCMMQRFFLIVFTLTSLVATLHGAKIRGCYGYWLLNLFSSLAGMVIAWRHVLLQSVDSAQGFTCSNILNSGVWKAPWMCVFRQFFQGDAECAQLTWSLFDLSVPEWSLLFFVAMVLLSVFQLFHLVRLTCLKAAS
ncbi:disulfide bond formation protein B [Pseudomonas sp. Irchel 3E20]|uniref:disulfide bond formation protein B n=1 Tax=Pseudomonas sp. Irchel 3E20 TaxID=2008983 RepID=UPI000BA3A6A1|nr:disulfide bond formation protein B [Pseudomonas sp. Irchel 3E20]